MYVCFGATCEGQAAEVSSTVILVLESFSSMPSCMFRWVRAVHSVCIFIVANLSMFSIIVEPVSAGDPFRWWFPASILLKLWSFHTCCAYNGLVSWNSIFYWEIGLLYRDLLYWTTVLFSPWAEYRRNGWSEVRFLFFWLLGLWSYEILLGVLVGRIQSTSFHKFC